LAAPTSAWRTGVVASPRLRHFQRCCRFPLHRPSRRPRQSQRHPLIYLPQQR
jgi:hypothetical protein